MLNWSVLNYKKYKEKENIFMYLYKIKILNFSNIQNTINILTIYIFHKK